METKNIALTVFTVIALLTLLCAGIFSYLQSDLDTEKILTDSSNIQTDNKNALAKQKEPEEWKPSDFYIENYDIDIIGGGLISYNRNGEIQNRISLIINNSEKDKVVSVVVAYPKERDFRGISGGTGILEIKTEVLKNSDLVELKISDVEFEKSLLIDSKLKVEELDKSNFVYKTFNITLDSVSRDSNSSGEMVDINSAVTSIMAYTTTNLGENDKLYMWILGSFAGGTGMAGDPWQISNWNQLNEIRDNMTASYILINDLTPATDGYVTYASGSGWNPIGRQADYFTGVFDGGNFTIVDLQIHNDSVWDYGMIATIATGGTIQNIGFVNITIESTSSTTVAGGCVGRVQSQGVVQNCYATGNITIDGSAPSGTGGIVGLTSSGGSVLNSYSHVDIRAGRRLGGGIGYQEGNCSNSYSVGTVIVDGGAGANAGGFTGYQAGNTYNCFYDSDVNGYSDTGYGVPKTTAEMQTFSTFDDVNWDIALIGSYTTEAWFIDAGVDYPRLGFEFIPPDVGPPDVIINNPLLNTNFSTGVINFNVTATDDIGMDSCWVTIDDGVSNLTMINSIDSDYNVTNETVLTGDYTAKFYCNDTLNKINNTETREFTVDLIIPTIEIVQPTNNTYQSDNTLDILYEFTEANPDTCWYSNDTMFANTTIPCGDNITTITWTEGQHNVTIWINDSVGNEILDYVNFTIDSTKPNINITSPQNNTYQSDNTLDILYTVSDTNLDSCWYSNDTMFANTTINCGDNITTITWTEGEHNVTIWANDSIGNVNLSYVNFTIDTTVPTIEIVQPTNNTYQSDNTLDILYEFTEANPDTCWYSNDTMFENTTINCGDNITSVTWAEGEHHVTIWINDSLSNIALDYVNFTIDTINPNLEITFPENNTYQSDNTLDILYTVSDTNLDSCWYSNDTMFANTTINCGDNITTITWTEGEHNVTIWAKDSANNVNLSYVNFTIDTINPTISIVQPTNNTYQSDNTLDILYEFTEVNLDRCWYSNDTMFANTTINCGDNITSVTWTEGEHNVTIWINDSVGNVILSYVNFTMDTTTPTISIVQPTNNTYQSDNTLDILYTVSDANLDSCWYSNDTMFANTTINCGTNITTITWTEGEHNVTIWVNDSANNVELSYVNFTIDTTAPSIVITTPINGSHSSNILLNINYTVSDANLDSCWYSNDTYSTNTSIACGTNITTITWTGGQHHITIWTNDSANNVNSNYITFDIVNIISDTYNDFTTETLNESFITNLTASGISTANLYYNGTAYAGTISVSGNSYSLLRVLDIPKISPENATFYWELTYSDSTKQNLTTHHQYINATVFDLCNGTSTEVYINFTFKDSGNSSTVNGAIDLSIWNYWLGTGSNYKTLSFTNTTTNPSYGFCLTPTDKKLYNNLTIQYSGNIYPQRRWTYSTDLTNITTNQILYLLSINDGIYSVYKVQTTVGEVIQGVSVVAERQIGGVWTIMETGITDSAGSVTFWLNPDYDHRLIFSKSGYTTVQVIIRPSSVIYTVVMGTGAGGERYNSSIEGITWKIRPKPGVLSKNTNYTFEFNVTSDGTLNLTGCKLELLDTDNTVLTSVSGCALGSENISISFNITQSILRGRYSFAINGGGYFIVDSDAHWSTIEINIPSRGTIFHFFTHLRDLDEFGEDSLRAEFSRIILFFLITFVLLGVLCKFSGWDFATSGGVTLLVGVIILIASYGGFFTISYVPYLADNPSLGTWMNQWTIALISTMGAAGWGLNRIAGGMK